MTNYKTVIKKFAKLLALYGVQIWVMLFIANVVAISFIRYKAQAQGCMTQADINSSQQCLYILNGNIYQQGSKGKPHKGHSCGMDVTSIIPSNHKSNTSKYLLPNFVGAVCSGNAATPTPTPTQAPTQAPTQRPTAAPTQAPTQQPTQAPTNSPNPTQTPTSNPAATKTATPVPTKTPTNQPTAIPSPQATETPDNSGFLRLISYLTGGQAIPTPTQIANSSAGQTNVITPAPIEGPEKRNNFEHSLIYWSTIFSYVSFVILLGTAAYWLVQKIKEKVKSQSSVSTPVPPVNN